MITREALLEWVQSQPEGYDLSFSPEYDHDPDTPNAVEIESRDPRGGGIVDWLKVEFG